MRVHSGQVLQRVSMRRIAAYGFGWLGLASGPFLPLGCRAERVQGPGHAAPPGLAAGRGLGRNRLR
jgi:hypothetical protein